MRWLAGGNNNQQSMATTLLQHPTHDHPLESLDVSHKQIPSRRCRLCIRNIFARAYYCQECEFFCHKACAEAPPLIECHPLHPLHPLTLHHDRSFECNACGGIFGFGHSSFKCNTCNNFNMDIVCALSTLSYRGGPQEGKTPEQIILPIHHHPLTSFFARHEFVWDGGCQICKDRVEGDGYICSRDWCLFVIHKGCFRDLYYADDTKAPQIYHEHPLETSIAEDTGSRRCASCRSNTSGEFIGCMRCEVFIHRECIQAPEILQYPPHPEHTLALCIYFSEHMYVQCQSCSSYMQVEFCYYCTSCDFYVHVRCALQTLAYCEEGMRVEIHWHEHPLLLFHRPKSAGKYCFLCMDGLGGPTYECKELNCGLSLHARCSEIEFEPTIIHPQHTEHLLALHKVAGGCHRLCNACFGRISHFSFSCELCAFYLHVKCATRVPTLKHYLHEHELLRLDKVPSLDCNRCGASTDSPLFRCVPCNFNLHEKCMELPLIVKHKTHFHPLILRESYVEDDSGEYYCDLCEKRRDGRLGVYVCGQCRVTWAFHIECILPELRKVFANKSKTSVMKRLAEQIARKSEEVCAAEAKLEEVKRELDELMRKQVELTSEEE